MCLPHGIATLLGLSFAFCDASPNLGPDLKSNTDAAPITLAHKRRALKITCPEGAASCMSRADAICGGNYETVGSAASSPRAQVLVDLRLVTVNSDSPYELVVACR